MKRTYDTTNNARSWTPTRIPPTQIIMRSRHLVTTVVVISAAFLAAACGSTEIVTVTPPTPFASSPTDTPISVVTETEGRVWLEAPVGKFQSGWATLSEESSNLIVEIQVAPSEAVAQPAHIHHGTCDQLGKIEHSLENVIGGHSMTVLPGASLESVATGDLAVNIHLSFSDFATFTACGEIPVLP